MISPVSVVAPTAPTLEGPAAGAVVAPAESFAVQLERAVGAVDGQVTSADQSLFDLASGREVDLHGSMIALEEADIALRAMVSVRDKVIGAYEQILNLAI